MNQRNDRLLCADFTALPELETDHLETSTYKAPNIIITNLTSYNKKGRKTYRGRKRSLLQYHIIPNVTHLVTHLVRLR